MSHTPRWLEVRPARGPPDTVLVASASKSATHRAILLGTLTPHTVIDAPLVSNDTVASLRLAAALGARVSAEPLTDAGRRLLDRVGAGVARLSGQGHGEDVPAEWEAVALNEALAAASPQVPRPLLAAQVRLHIERDRVPPAADGTTVDVANSGTTLRIGTALCSTTGRKVTLTGDKSLLSRPMGPLVEALGHLGVDATCHGRDGRPPVTVRGPLAAGRTEIRGDVSSQYISALLVAAQAARGPIEVAVTTPLKSAPYVDVTLAMVRAFGGQVAVVPATSGRGPTYRVPGRAKTEPSRVRVPGDFSSAAYPLVAAAITGGRVTLAGMDPDSDQGDRAVLDVLRSAGADVAWTDDAERGGHLVTVTAPAGPLQAFQHSFRDTPDLFPPLAVLAARASGRSALVDAAHVRLKECDRVAAMATGLAAVGVTVEEQPDALYVDGAPGAPVESARIESHDDHRILMSFATLALVGPGPLYISDPGCYHVSYPRFRMDVDALGGETRVVEHAAVPTRLAHREASP